jgi:hypothetical protein
VRASTLGTPSSGAGSLLAGVPVVLCNPEAAVSDLPRLFEALITEAVVEPIVTGLGCPASLDVVRRYLVDLGRTGLDETSFSTSS